MSGISNATLRKAARMRVFKRSDGTFQVAGDSGTYEVFLSARGDRYICGCVAGQTGARCSHAIAVSSHHPISVPERNAPEHCKES